jgi:hypothetical protein
MFKAIRRCKFHRSIAIAIKNPPKKRKISGFAYGEVASLIVVIFNTGNSTIGISAVTGIGNASVIHHMPIRLATAAVYQPSFERFAGEGLIIMPIKTSNPTIRPIFCLILYEAESTNLFLNYYLLLIYFLV